MKLRPQQRIHSKQIVRHVTVAESSSESEADDRMDSDEMKQVSFSPEVQVRVFSEGPAKTVSPKKMKVLKGPGVKSRLGNGADQVTSPRSLLNVKKISMKAEKFSPSIGNRMSKMKSDNMSSQAANVHSRLDINNRNSTNQLTSKIKNFKIDSATSKTKGSSVFNRLGRN